MSRCPSRLPSKPWPLTIAALLVLALGACGSGEPPPPLPEPATSPQQARTGGIEDEIFPHVSAQMPAEGLEPDGRMAPWALAAQVGATLQALAEACGQHDAAELRRMQDDQRGAIAEEGVDMDRFETVWTWAYRQARQKITMQPAADLERGCASMHQMQLDAERMGEMMRPMPLP